MREFELAFEVAEMPEDVEDGLAEALDAVVASHHGVTTVTLSASGPDCVAAAVDAITALRRLGAAPRRLVDDLVARGEIAERAGVTRQAVGQWVRGERHSGAPFPPPFVLTGGGLWLWGEVVEALAARGVEVDPGLVFPTRWESQVIGGLLASTGAGTDLVGAGALAGSSSGSSPAERPRG